MAFVHDGNAMGPGIRFRWPLHVDILRLNVRRLHAGIDVQFQLRMQDLKARQPRHRRNAQSYRGGP